MSIFAERFDAFYNAGRDYGSYLEAKGKRQEGNRIF
jgi:hypothetical protein